MCRIQWKGTNSKAVETPVPSGLEGSTVGVGCFPPTWYWQKKKSQASRNAGSCLGTCLPRSLGITLCVDTSTQTHTHTHTLGTQFATTTTTWWGQVFWHLWIGRARHPDPLEPPVDFIAVVEHRLIPARVRGEWARPRAKGSASVWAPVSQESSHVGHAGVGVVSMRSAHFHSLPPATAQFRRFF